MLEMTRLKVFCEVAGHGSFTRAAEVLGYAQPSVSHHIAQLERELGAQLFDRQPKRIQLTPAGQVFLDYARPALLKFADAQREVSETVRSGSSRLRIAAFPTASATLMPAAAAAFRDRRGEVALSLTEADPPVSLPGLVAGEYDLALVYDYPALGVAPDPDIELEPLFGDHMVLALPAGHRLALSGRLPLEALSRELWVTPHPCMCRDALVFACRNAGFSPDVVSETNDYMAMQGLVAAGVGVALLPRLAVAIARRPGVALIPLTELTIERVTFIATRRGAYKSPATEAFRTALRSALHAAEDASLPLEPYDPEHALAQPPVSSEFAPAGSQPGG
ncbi:MAG TPA: LysR family transcriptional regulator [Streptosporangiaceae bacterium]|nr:LysR family transcriptional regulator [Streptosporangiaceae bacterium]